MIHTVSQMVNDTGDDHTRIRENPTECPVFLSFPNYYSLYHNFYKNLVLDRSIKLLIICMRLTQNIFFFQICKTNFKQNENMCLCNFQKNIFNSLA